jgi:Skp family chaperone for outer membrane proteins
MKKFALPAAALSLWLLIPAASAQVSTGTTNIADRVARIILPDQAAFSSPLGSALVDRPARPERPDYPAELKLRVRSFEGLREIYLARQDELVKKWNSATTDRERERLRAQLQGLREEWREKSRALREETKTRMEELKGELSKYREALDAAKDNALDHQRPRH